MSAQKNHLTVTSDDLIEYSYLVKGMYFNYSLLTYGYLEFLFFSSDVNECLKIECLNNATCVNRDGSYQCDCLPGYTGQFCEIGKIVNYQELTHISLASVLCDIGKQCRTRSDTTECGV